MENVGTISIDLIVNSNAFEKKVKEITKDTGKSFDNSFSKIEKTIATAFSVATITAFGKSAVSVASDVQSAWTGLNSIVEGTGNSFSTANDFIKNYTKDGLLSIQEAATAYKNLLSRGYDTTQIENTLIALKDSAAFGRQASYDLGEAVVTATEGLKNENSILVDNAGVQKNVAKMWEEYAIQLGISSANLTQAQKIQAEYNGILNETRFQMGDAAVYTQTLAGQAQILKGSFSALQSAVGKVIAPIGQLFIPYIVQATNAITNFFVKIQELLSIFGLEMPDVVSKTSLSMGEAVSSIDDVGSTAINAAKNVSNTGTAATKAAKDIKRAFGSIDEINVLSTSNNESQNNESPSSSAVVELIPTVNDETLSTEVETLTQKMKRYFEPLQNINFDNLINAFTTLHNSTTPIIGMVGKGLEWLYFNILVPLGTWTIEDALPSFFDLLSNSFKVLNPLIQSFSDIFGPVWENLLKPLLSWTGGTIVKTLNLVADALGKVGDWMNNNQTIVDMIVKSLVVFFGLWKVTELLAFVQMAGGLTSAFVSLTASIWSNIAAKVADKTDTIILTALYAKDFVTSLATSTAAIAKQIVQWWLSTAAIIANKIALVASTAATVAATAATWLFNAALVVLTSPITLVVFAIAGLIAIIVLLVKHWNSVKEAAENVWEMIKKIWNLASSWFNENVVQPISSAFSNLWNSVKNTATSCWNGILSLFSKGGKIFSGIADGIANVFKTIVNVLIGGINKVISIPFKKINSLLNSIRNVSVAGIEPFKSLIKENPLPVPSIPKLYNGAWLPANNPRLAIVGDNKREAEIVAPESKIYAQTLKAIKDSSGIGGKQEIEITIYHKYEDGRTIIQKINQAEIDAGEILLLT